jgi:hypothetical protein
MLVNGDGGRKKTLSIGDLAPLELHVQEATGRVLEGDNGRSIFL